MAGDGVGLRVSNWTLDGETQMLVEVSGSQAGARMRDLGIAYFYGQNHSEVSVVAGRF